MAVTESFVSCSDQSEIIGSALDAACRGTGRGVVMTAPPGGGKTHALRTIMSAVADEGHPVFMVSCRATMGVPFGPWISLLEQTRRRADLDPLAPMVTEPERPLTPRDHADRLVALWSTMGRPVVALVDDAHLMNSSSSQVVEHLLGSVASESVLVVLATADERMAQRWTALPHATEVTTLRLDPLHEDDIVALLRRCGADESPHRVRAAARHLLDECRGDPLVTVARLRRLTQRFAPNALVDALLTEPVAVRPDSPRDWLRVWTDELAHEHREVLARWTLAAGLTRAQFCEATDTPRAALDAAIGAGVAVGLLESLFVDATEVSCAVSELLTASLPPLVTARTHVAVGRALLRWSPTAVVEAAHHLERAAGLVPGDEFVEVLDHATEVALAAYAFDEADRCAGLAERLSPDGGGRADRLLRRARALRGLSRTSEADEFTRQAAAVAAAHGDADLLAQAAVDLAIPADWRVGCPETQRWLEQALAAQPSPPWRVRVLAALAHQHFMLPLSSDASQRWSWQLRPDLAARFADEALAQARILDDDDALIAALLAWRSVYRQPEHRERRRASSSEALTLAIRRRDTGAMVQAAVRRAVDELESGDRDGFEHAAAVARWAADQSADLRLMWRAQLLQATRATLDGDLATLERAKLQAVALGRQAEAPGRDVAELVLDRHVMALSHGWSVVAALQPDANWPIVHHPLGIAGAAEALARAGCADRARALLGRLRWPADVNTSMLLVTALAGRASVLCADRDTARAVLPTLVRFAGHVAVDPEALWVEGPVGLIGAQVARFLGDGPLAARLLAQAEACNQRLDCARTSATLVELRRHDGRRMVLPEREHAVLRLLADGLGNAQIARVLNFSVSTIRRETTSLYQRLGVANRAAAVAKAHELHLL